MINGDITTAYIVIKAGTRQNYIIVIDQSTTSKGNLDI
jgi:hypothetical protein